MKKRRWVYGIVFLLWSTLCACSPAKAVANTDSVSNANPIISSGAQAESSSVSEEVIKAAKALEIAVGFDTTITELNVSEFPPPYQTYHEPYYELGITIKNVNGVWKNADLYGNVLPYDQIMRAYRFDRLGNQVTDSVLYVQKDGEWSAIELKDRILISFKPEKDAPTSFLSDFDVIVYKGETLYLQYYGQPTTLPLELFFPAFDRSEFKLYAGSKPIGAYNGRMIVGDYEDEILFDFNQGGGAKDCEAVAVLGDITPVVIETVKPGSSLIPEEYRAKLTPKLPMHAIRLKDTGATLFDFYYTDEGNGICHVFAVSTPQAPYKELDVLGYAINHPYVEPIADYLFAGKNREGDYIVLCRTIGKSGDHINVFQFKG